MSEVVLVDGRTLSFSNSNIELRLVNDDDYDTLVEIYRSTRESELAMTDWSADQKQQFIKSQFDAQSYHYKTYYTHTYHWLILYNQDVAGRLYISTKDQVTIMDISLLPKFRNMGIGSSLLQDIQKMATIDSVPVSIHVEKYNPALHLYQRLGFRIVKDVNSIYYQMEWSPQ